MVKDKMTVNEIEAAVKEIKADIAAITDSRIIIMGKEYKLSEWLTVKNYCEKYDLRINRVQNWIDRNVIPDGCIIVIPELNGLRLLKDQPYEVRKYETRVQ